MDVSVVLTCPREGARHEEGAEEEGRDNRKQFSVLAWLL